MDPSLQRYLTAVLALCSLVAGAAVAAAFAVGESTVTGLDALFVTGFVATAAFASTYAYATAHERDHGDDGVRAD